MNESGRALQCNHDGQASSDTGWHVPYRVLLIVVGLAWAAISSGSRAQAVRALTADQCVQIGLESNRSVQASRAQIAAAEARHWETQTARLPQIQGQGQYQRLSDIPEFDIPFPLPDDPGLSESITIAPAILNRYTLQASVQQPLFTGLRLTNQVRAAGHEEAAARHEAEATEGEVAYRIREAYWQLHNALAARAVVAKALEQAEAQLADVQNRRAQGMALESDVLAVQARRSEIRLQQLDAADAVRVARLNLNYQMGVPLDTRIEPTGSVNVRPLADSLSTLTARALQQQPELQALDETAQALDASVGMARAGWFPDVRLQGTYYYARPNPFIVPQDDAFAGTWEVGVALSMDLWTWGRTRAQVDRAHAERRQAEAQRDDLREAVRLDVTQQVLAVRRAIEAVQVTEQGRQEAEAAYRNLQARFQQGAALTTELLAAEATFRRAELRHAEARADYAIARAALRRALGDDPRRP
jgi:outer membrane protein TolC